MQINGEKLFGRTELQKKKQLTTGVELRIKREGKKYAHIFQVNTFLAFNRFITR